MRGLGFLVQMATAKKVSGTKTTAKKATATKAAAKKSAKKAAQKTSEANHCWPGFEPAPGKKAGEKGSCKPVSGTHSKATKRATQKAAAASKLEKQGKPNPRER